MRLQKLSDSVFLVNAKSSRDLAKLFVRIQENYESPKFRDKVFTLSEFKAWYKASRGKKRFTYYSDWGGFNVPGHIINRFRDGSFGRLSKGEKWLCSKLNAVPLTEKYYVIGANVKNASVMKHELAHALYYTNMWYRQKVSWAMSEKHESLAKVREFLRKLGYGENVIEDECHAWILADHQYLKTQGIWHPVYETVRKDLEKNFRKMAKQEGLI